MEKFKGMNMKVKRKDLEDVNDDFSDFCLSSPARKIRRLDIELPPIVEEEETDHSMGYEQMIPESAMPNGEGSPLKVPEIEELPRASANEQKAIVLFKPVNNGSVSYSNFVVDPNLISSFKTDQGLPSVNMNAIKRNEKENDVTDGDNGDTYRCRAVIPWVPPQQFNLGAELPASQPESLDSMDAEEPDITTMDFEEAGASDVGQQASEFYDLPRINEGFPPHQWQQQHCMFPQPPQNTVAPLVWYR